MHDMQNNFFSGIYYLLKRIKKDTYGLGLASTFLEETFPSAKICLFYILMLHQVFSLKFKNLVNYPE